MRKWIVLGAVLVAVVAAVLVAAANLDRWLDENRDLIEAQASDALARDVRIGDLDVSLWGGLGVRVRELQVAEDPAYGTEAFLDLEEGLVRVAFWPALFGRIEVTRAVLDAPRLRVVRDARGLSTDSLAAGDAEPSVAADEKAAAAKEDNEEAGFELVVDTLVVENGRIVFEDRTGRKPTELVIEALDLEVTDIDDDKPLAFDLTATWLGARTQNLQARGKLGPVLGEGTAPMSFDVAFELDPLPVDALLRIEAVAASMPDDTRLSGELTAHGTLAGTTEAFDFDLHGDATKLAVTMVDSFVKPAGSSLLIDANGQVGATEVRVAAFSFGPADARIEGDARLGTSEASPYEAKLHAVSLPIEAWTPLLPAFEGIQMAGQFGLDLRAKGKASDTGLPLLDGRFDLASASITMPDTPPIEKLQLETVLAGHKATGDGGTLELGGAPIRFEFQIADLNSTLVSFAFDAAELPLAALEMADPGTEADDVLQDLRVVGQLDYGGELLAGQARFASPQGRLQAVDYQKLQGRAETDGTHMVLHELAMTMLGGQVHMNGSLDSSDPAQPGFVGDLKLSGVQISDLVASQLPHLGSVASGRLDTTLSLSGRGLETDAILHSLTGVGSIEIADGRLQGVNIAEDVLGGVTVIGGLTSWLSPEVKRKHPRLFSKQDTDFQTAEMTLHVKDGRIRADALAIETDDFSLLGAGTIGLDGSLDIEADFRTSIALASTLVGVADPTRYLLNGEKRIAIPVHITGELGAPRVRPDQNFIASTLTRATLGTVKTIVGDLIGKPGSNARSSKTSTGGAAPGAGAGEEGGQATEQSAAGESESPPTAKPEARPKRKSVEGVLEQGLQDLLKPRSTETPKN